MDMFPYPSGAGLHVGHPLGYIGTDVYARYLRMRGENVLHTMGFDAFGLPAEQYALQTGQHPAITTDRNIVEFRRQLRALGLAHDQRRSVSTTDPSFYRWTQWIFAQIFNSFYDRMPTAGSAERGRSPSWSPNWTPAAGSRTRAPTSSASPGRSWTRCSAARSSTGTGWPTSPSCR